MGYAIGVVLVTVFVAYVIVGGYVWWRRGMRWIRDWHRAMDDRIDTPTGFSFVFRNRRYLFDKTKSQTLRFATKHDPNEW